MQLDERLASHDMLLRVLAYGSAKTKKTWWAGKCAEAGYNVLLIDGDDGWHILSQIDKAAKRRIQIVNMTDERGKPVFAKSFARLMKDGKLIWDEKMKRSSKLNPNENCISIDLDLLDSNCVFVVDSWTALARSLLLQYADENMIDLSAAEEGDDKWGYYRWAGTLATWMLSQLTALSCHVICIAHTDVYEKRSKDGKKVEWSKRQVKSTSGPHAMQLPAQFSDILYFHSKGSATKISTKGDEEADGGSRLIAPGIYNWDDLQFIKLINAAGLALPPSDLPLIDYSMANAPALPAGQTNLVKPVAKPAANIQLGKKPSPLIFNAKK